MGMVFDLLQPGIYFDIPAAHYYSLPYVSNSYLTRLKHCPANAQIPAKSTKDMDFGRAFHSFILEPGKFKSHYFILPDTGNTAFGKREKAKAILDNLGKDAIEGDDADSLIGMSGSVAAHPFGRKCIAGCRTEVTIIWDHVLPSGYQIRMKARIDGIPEARGVIFDLKSAFDASPVGFRRAIVDNGYYRQGAVYLDGINAASRAMYECGETPPYMGKFDAFVFIAVEKKPPYRCECYELEPDFLEFGQNEYHELLEVERSCREAKNGPYYPAYQNAGLQTIGLPQYMRPQG